MLANDAPLASLETTYNQTSFGTYFDIAKLDAGNTSAQMLRDNLDLLPDAESVGAALNSLSGEIYGTHHVPDPEHESFYECDV